MVGNIIRFDFIHVPADSEDGKTDSQGLFCSKGANYLIWLGPEQTLSLSLRLSSLESNLIIWNNKQKHSSTSTKPYCEKQSHIQLTIPAVTNLAANTWNTTLFIHIIETAHLYITRWI